MWKTSHSLLSIFLFSTTIFTDISANIFAKEYSIFAEVLKSIDTFFYTIRSSKYIAIGVMIILQQGIAFHAIGEECDMSKYFVAVE